MTQAGRKKKKKTPGKAATNPITVCLSEFHGHRFESDVYLQALRFGRDPASTHDAPI